MDPDNIRASRLLVRILRFCGLWPAKRSSFDNPWIFRCQRLQPYLLQTVLTFSFTAMMWIDAFLSSDFKHSTDVLFITLTMTGLVAKTLNNWRHVHIAYELLEEWSTNDQFRVRFGQELDVWEAAHRRFSRVTHLYFICSVGVIPCLLLSSLLNDPIELPFYFWVPFDLTKSVNFWFLYVYQVFASAFTCLSNTTLDLLNCYLMLHVSLCLEMLGMRMAALAPMGNAMESERKLQLQFISAIQLHSRVKIQANQVQVFISNSTVVQILLSAIILCLSIYRLQMLNVLQDPGLFAAMAQYLFSMIMQIFLPSIYGNEIIYNADQLPRALYACQWPSMSLKMRRQIMRFMIYLNRPMQLRAGGFFVVGLPLFTKTMNQAYSLLALLLNVNNK